MEVHKLDPNTGEDEMAFAQAMSAQGHYAQASLVPNGLATDRDPNNPASWGKIGRNEDCPAAAARGTSTAMAGTLNVAAPTTRRAVGPLCQMHIRRCCG